MLRLALFCALALAAAGASAKDYQVRIASSVEGGRLTVVPQLVAAPGARLRYEMTSTKEGGASQANSSQGGSVNVGPDGQATLSKLTVSVGPQDRYVISVKVFDGAKLVAEDVLRYPGVRP